MIKVGIIGDDTELSIELLRLLVSHPDVEIGFIDNERLKGQKVSDVYKGFMGDIDVDFSDKSPLDVIDVLFCCNTKDKTRAYMRETPIPSNLKIIDLSPDFRIPSENNKFEYGLPELNRRATCSSKYVANPGSIATCVELALLPLAKHLLLNSSIYVNIIAGSSVFSGERNDEKVLSVSSHLKNEDYEEIRSSLRKLQNSFEAPMYIVPVKAAFKRGIMATVLTDLKVNLDELKEVYRQYYDRDSFTFLVDDLAMGYVINTNKCYISLSEQNEKLLVTCCIDNMIKGSAGQAIHNMNLLFNLEETTGLRLNSFAV